MKTSLYIFLVIVLVSIASHAQVTNTGMMDTSTLTYKGKVTIEGYIDAYYAYDFNEPSDKNRPYFVSMNRHNEATINLAYIDLKYTSSSVRARFVPGFGTYINANYAAEPGSLKNIVEASAGIRLSEKRNIWVDAGVLGSPFTNESAFSRDHLAYTRSFAPEYVPYYLTGVKVTVPVSAKVNTYLYLLNGWQQIVDQNESKSIATQVEVRPNENLLLNWDTYFGKESSASDTTVGMRYFSDVYMIFTKGKWSVTSCFYIGQQKQAEGDATWWQFNVIGRFNITEGLSVTGRFEYFEDTKSAQIVPITDVSGFETSSGSLGLNYKVADNVLLRLEGRTFFSDKKVYSENGNPVNSSNMLTTNITVWF